MSVKGDIYIPVFFGEEEIGWVYFKNPVLNDFQGVNTHGRQILKSAAGYYIGDLCKTDYLPFWEPNSRDSERYWSDREDAEKAMLTGDYQPKF